MAPKTTTCRWTFFANVLRMLRRSFLLCVVVFGFVWFYHYFFYALNYRYSIVLDAGSTGTRIHVYRFSYNGKLPAIIDELFLEKKPGISSFRTSPEKVYEQIYGLLETASKWFPPSAHGNTPIVLKATAGLRSLKQEDSIALLNEASRAIDTSSFLRSSDDIGILDGTNEGLYSWITLSHLLNTLHPNSRVLSIDLGGMSMQVTAVTRSNDTFEIFGQDISLYTSSFDMGLMKARHQLLKNDNFSSEKSICIFPGVSAYFMYDSQNVTVMGKEESRHNRFHACSSSLKDFVKSRMILPFEKFAFQKDIYVFSYFFDAAVQSSLVKDIKGGEFLLKDLENAALKACHVSNSDHPFLCFDLSYMHSILSHGLELDENTILHVVKKIKGIEISWTLGLALKAFSDQQQF